MAENFDLETYLCISPNEFEIYLFNKKNLTNLYIDKIKLNTNSNNIDLNILDKFLKNNIFKIEKLSGNFIKNIFLVIKTEEIKKINFAIKKKNYEKSINKKFLEKILNDSKDIFRENYQNHYIMHILIIRYLENGNYHSTFNDKFIGDYLCVEFQFIYTSFEFISKINKVLRKYQIILAGCLDSNYIKNYFFNDQLEFSEMIYKIQVGSNENEVKLIPKNIKNTGFFEKFFQLFS